MTGTQQLLAYHSHQIQLAREAMAKHPSPIIQHKMVRKIDHHTAEVRKLDRTATAADEAARRETRLVRT